MIINNQFAPPNKSTFTIKPIAELLKKYVGDGKGWVDPFAGWASPAEITNDMNPERKAKYHMEAEEFCKKINGEFKGILFDPPYSYRQVTEHYKAVGMKATAMDTSANFTARVKNAIGNKIKAGGYAICFGWNSVGFGKSRGFKKIEILLVTHGSSHNDTICTVEKKIQGTLNPKEAKKDGR
tara:strand:- start:32 stop:577 length:546 start_codon:yes stop_codon:yes gene_type:complete